MKTLLVLILFSFVSVRAQQILIDEDFGDWQNIQPSYENTNIQSGLDFVSMKIFDDEQYLYFYLRFNEEINLQNDNNITIYIDTDNNSSTGLATEGIGAELKFNFGQRFGVFYRSGGSVSVEHYKVGFLSAPTVTSKEFEIAYMKNSVIGGTPVFPGQTIKFYFKNESSSIGFIPPIEKQFENNVYAGKDYFLSKHPETQFRVMTYNVERDHLFEPDRKEYFRRIFQAINPDIIGFQEIYNHSAQETAELIAEFLPDYVWYGSHKNNDIIYVGKYPALSNYEIDGNTAFLLDLNDMGKQMLFISAHPPCCGNDSQRQEEIDHFMAFVRDAKNGGGPLLLPENSPIVIVGDMNLVGLSQQQKTLITGDIVNTGSYGQPFSPDWDNSNFEDNKQYSTGKPAAFTWYDEGSSYYPGRLDYVVYSGSVMKSLNSFALFTPAIDPDTLDKYGLQSDDVLLSSDHIPSAVDFKLITPVSVDSRRTIPNKFELMQNYPNPFNPETEIEYRLPSESFVTLKIFDCLGREIITAINKNQIPGRYKFKFDAADLSSGIYFYMLKAGEFSDVRKMILLK